VYGTATRFSLVGSAMSPPKTQHRFQRWLVPGQLVKEAVARALGAKEVCLDAAGAAGIVEGDCAGMDRVGNGRDIPGGDCWLGGDVH
jgi:hypothetical protein